MNFVRALVGLRSSRFRRAFERSTRDPEWSYRRLWEKEVLPRLKQRVSDRLEDYPITEYRDYDVLIRKSFEGTHSLLTGEEVSCWGISTGTTGNHKVYPITPAYRKQIQRVGMVYFRMLLDEFPQLLEKP